MGYLVTRKSDNKMVRVSEFRKVKASSLEAKIEFKTSSGKAIKVREVTKNSQSSAYAALAKLYSATKPKKEELVKFKEAITKTLKTKSKLYLLFHKKSQYNINCNNSYQI